MSATDITTNFSEWNPAANNYTQPKTNASGGKAITILNPKTNRSLHITTPPMMTWGISDYVDQKTQESDGKYTISLNFPNSDYANADTDLFLKKLKQFEEQVISDAVANSESWFGKKKSRELVEDSFFPFLKYQKDKLTKQTDVTKPPSIRAKVSNFEGKWMNLEIYDTRSQLLFPCENPTASPMDFVPKMSNVMCLLQCGGVWVGGKGWGITWKLVQCVVKPRENISVLGKCRIPMSKDVKEMLDSQNVDDTSEADSSPVADVHVEDSDNEEPAPEPSVQAQAEEPVSVQEPVEEKKPIAKKVVAKKVVAPTEEAEPEKPAVKKVIKKPVAK